MNKHYHSFFILLSIFFLLQLSAQESNFPEKGNWEEKPSSAFNEAVEFARENEYSGSTDLRQAIFKGFEHEPYHEIHGPTKPRGGPAGMIVKNGFVVAQWGDIKRVDMTFSVTKSFLSTTALIALNENLINSASEHVIKYVWDDTFQSDHNSKITWRHLLEQTSDWSGKLWGTNDWADRPPQEGTVDHWKARELNEPGTQFKYNDVRVNVLAYSLLQIFRKPLPEILKNKIMDPIGATSTWRWYGYDNSWTTIDGLKIQSVSGGGHWGGGMFINTEDMARFGLLFLNNGSWDGKQLLPAALIEEAMTPSKINNNYGYMWWLNRAEDPQWEGVNRDIFYAAGFGGNFIIVDRENDLVVVTRWLEPSNLEKFMQLINKVLN